MSLIHTKILPTERYTEQQLRDMFDQILNESNVNLIL